MPQLGETVTEGTIIRWAKAVGDHVDQDEVLFEVSTDKVDSEVPSPAAGYLTEIVVPEGETVDVGARLAVISEQAPAAGAPPPAPPADEPAPPPPEPAAAAPEVPPPPPPPPPPPTRPAPAPATARAGGDGSGAGRQAAAQTSSPILSPVVRRLITEHQLDPDQIAGTGPGGRVTRGDVLAIVDARRQGRAATAPAGAPAFRPASLEAPAPGPRDEVVPFTNIRRRTAEHMLRSRATSAHTLTAIEVDFENVERVRQAERERFKQEEGVSLSYLPFISRAVIDSLRDYPRLNASVGEDSLILHHDIHLGIAVDLEGEGLIVPVIHDAASMRLPALAREVAELASRARSRKLTADDIAKGTFTITNPGPFGTLFTMPIINQPQVAILSTDGIHRRPVVVSGPGGDESIAIHSVGILALSYDHRAVDGAYASGFLAKLRDIIETRDWYQEI
jgi:pyruvate dehydrogenase E2 component (dihydrolipoamide acetyltransferase)